MWKKIVFVACLFVLQGVLIFSLRQRPTYSVLMLGQTVTVSENESWYISDSQLKTIAATMDLNITIDSSTKTVTVSKGESSTESVETTLKPLVRDGRMEIRERDLYGTWVTQIGETAQGYIFLDTEPFGPYTVVKTVGAVGDIDGVNDVSLYGHYHVTESNTLILNFKHQVEGESPDLIPVEQTEIWQVEQTETMVTMRQEGRVLSMVKPEFERN